MSDRVADCVAALADAVASHDSDTYSGSLAEATFAAGRKVANSITPTGVGNGTDATGGTVGSLTEAVMGLTAAMVKIADAIDRVAGAIEDRP